MRVPWPYFASIPGPMPALKGFAAMTLPTLEHHLAMVKDLNAQ
jgi:hypothetical protein